jgi:hypothetical protein
MLVDLDPKRPAGISASDAEHKAALTRAGAVRDWLAAAREPEVIEPLMELLAAARLPNLLWNWLVEPHTQ